MGSNIEAAEETHFLPKPNTTAINNPTEAPRPKMEMKNIIYGNILLEKLLKASHVLMY